MMIIIAPFFFVWSVIIIAILIKLGISINKKFETDIIGIDGL